MSVAISSKPPRIVVASTVGQCGAIAAGFFVYALFQPAPSLLGRLFAWALVATVLFFFFRALLRGANWTRWLLLVFIVVGVVALPNRVSESHESWQSVLYIAQAFVQVVATALLFFPVSNRWFSRSAPAYSVKWTAAM